MGEEGEKEVGGEEVGREEGGVKGPMEMNVGRVRAGCEGVRIVEGRVWSCYIHMICSTMQ